MTKDDLIKLGFTEEDVINRLVDKLCERYVDEEGSYQPEFEKRIEKAVREQVDKRISAAIETLITPKINEMVDGICLQETNKWGEAKGQKLTFTEYLTQRVDAYIREEVSYNGKSKSESDCSWRANTTRIAYMIHEHLQYNISKAVTDALGLANQSVRKGLEEAVSVALKQVTVKVETKVTS